MATVARGQITIVDLNDAKQVQVYLENSGADTQLYNTDDGSYTPDYSSSAITITPIVMVTGESSSQLAKCTNISYEITDNGTTYTLNSSTLSVTGYSMTSAGVLSIKKNLTGNNIVIKFSCTYTDTDTGQTQELFAYKTIIRSTSAAALFQALITAPTGTVFDQATSTADKTAVCKAYRGSTQDTSGSTFTWEYLDPSSATWKSVATSKVSTSSNVSTLTVSADDITNFQTYRCTVTDDGSTAEAYITFQDMTDPYQIEVGSTTGDKIVNGSGSTTIYARVWLSGEIIEDENTTNQKFTYTWTKYNKNGVATNWNDTSSTTKTGNPITVAAAEIDTKATFICEVTK